MIMERSPLTGRRKVDLGGSLPRWGTLLLGGVITVAIALAAWWVGRDRPVPRWITHGLVPALGWIYLVLVAVALVAWWRRRARGPKER
ncbi:MAG TPA: hypothetical protein VF832_04320 [Longimicrobiales bacterium]